MQNALVFAAVGLLAILAGLFAIKGKDAKKWAMGLGTVVLIMGLAFGGWSDVKTMTATGVTVKTEPVPGGSGTVELGKAATLYWNAYTGDWGEEGAKTKVGAAATVVNSEGSVLVSDAIENTTNQVSTGDSGTIYSTGATYYFDPVTYSVTREKTNVPDIQAYTVATKTNLALTAFDNTESTALTADDNANNTANYAGGSLGAGQVEPYYLKFKNNAANGDYRLGAILTFFCGDEMDDFELEENSWKEISVPSGDLSTTVTIYDDSNDATSCAIQRAYVPSTGKYIDLKEWDYVKYQFSADTDDTTGPSANGDSYFGAVFVDYACELDLNGKVVCDWYRHDNNNDPNDVGLNENLTGGFTTGYTGVTIEPQ